MLGIVYRVIAGHLADQARVARASAQCGAVTLIQRLGSALNLNVHFHMLFPDGVYSTHGAEAPRLRLSHAPTPTEVTRLSATIARRVGRHLERKGFLRCDPDQAWLTGAAGSDDPLNGVRSGSITYRIAMGPQAGRKVMTLQTVPADEDPLGRDTCKAGGFSLHAGVTARAGERTRPERLCR